MRIIHTADWHLGQLFHNYERFHEHQAFLDWLIAYLEQNPADVLLVSGDVFDTSNPSAQSIRQLYQFLGDLQHKFPALQVIITAGNHDSAQRIEAALPLVNQRFIHLIGTITRGEDGSIDYDKICVPLYDDQQKIQWICLAIPYLRMGDYPISGVSYSDGITAFYQAAVAYAQENYPNIPLIGMGHLHAMEAEVSDLDKTERQIMGGLEYIPTHAFDQALKYVALGHIHRAQWIGSEKRIRYSGSPLPLSFTEQNYQHQLMAIELNQQEIEHIESVPIPVITPLLRIPEEPKVLEEVLFELKNYSLAADQKTPYVGIQVLLDQPQPQLRYQIEQAMQGRDWKLAQITTRYPQSETSDSPSLIARKGLEDLHPIDVLETYYMRKHESALPAELKERFILSLNAVNEKESL